MAFGDVTNGWLVGSTSITSPLQLGGGSSNAANLKDLIVVVVAELGANTANVVTDNRGNTYTAVNAGTLSTVAGRMYYSVVTSPGLITQISVTMTNSSDDVAAVAAQIAGPFTATPLDRAPTNTTDATTPYTCAATGVLSQANEVIVAGLCLTRGQTGATATAPLALAQSASSAASNTANSCSAAIASQVVTATTSVTPAFATSSGTINGAVQIVATFRQGAFDTGAGAASGTSTVTGGGRRDANSAGNAAGTSTVTAGGRVDFSSLGSASATGSATAVGTTIADKLAAGNASAAGYALGEPFGYRLGLIAHTYSAGGATGSTTPPIDTTGANVLFRIIVCKGNTIPSVSDNYGNTFTFISDQDDGSPFGSPQTQFYFHSTTSQPIVGPGHTFTVTGTNASIYVSAWRNGGGPNPPINTFGTRGGFGTNSPTSSTTKDKNVLSLFMGASASSFSSVAGPYEILDLDTAGSTRFAGFQGYKLHTDIETIAPVYSTSPSDYVAGGYFSFKGFWSSPPIEYTTGTATAHGTAYAYSPQDPATGVSSGVSSASGVGLATTPGVTPPGLVAYSEGAGSANSGNSGSGIDTTGANLLIAHVTGYQISSAPLTDNYGNTWTQIGTGVVNNFVGTTFYYVNSQTPIVGPGHVVSWTSGSPIYAPVQFAAFYSSTTWSYDEIASGTGAFPHGTTNIVTEQAGELFVTGATNSNTFTAVSDSFNVLGIIPFVGGVHVSAAYAWKVAGASGTTVNPSWTGTDSGPVETAAFKGTFVAAAADTGTGTASGQGSATAVGSTGIDASGVGSASGVGAASGQGRSDARSVGASAGTGTATGIGRADAYATGNAAGTGTAAGIGRADTYATGSAAGTGTAVGIAEVGTATGDAAGTGSATGVGRSDKYSVGIAAGLGTATGASFTDAGAFADGAAGGLGSATGNSKSDVRSVGNAVGLGIASAIGGASSSGVGAAAGTSTAEAIALSPGQSVGQVLGIAYRLEAGLATGERRAGGSPWRYYPPTETRDAHVQGALLVVDYYLIPGRAVAERHIDAKPAGASLNQHVFVLAGRARGQRVGLIAGQISAAAMVPGAAFHVEHSILRDESIDIDHDFLLSDDRDFPFAA